MEIAKTLVLDPVQLHVKNRIDAGCASQGTLALNSGLWLYGTHDGDLTVRNGALVVHEGARLRGTIHVEGDIFVLGQIGDQDEGDAPTVVTCTGELHLAASSVVYGVLRCPRPAIYGGAKVRGSVQTTE